MVSNKHELKTAIFEDGTHAVLRADAANPRHMELIATFYDAAHAKDYVRIHSPAEEHQEVQQRAAKEPAKGRRSEPLAARPAQAAKATSKPLSVTSPRLAADTKPKQTAKVQVKPAVETKAKRAAAKPAPEAKLQNGIAELSERQAAVLKALRTLKDKKNCVEARAAELAKASSVPLGSLHSILASLEKKQMIKTERQGSPKHSAIYQVLAA
jgi:uncharacterized membrane protein